MTVFFSFASYNWILPFRGIGKADFTQAGNNQDNPIHDVLNTPAEGCSDMPASPSKDVQIYKFIGDLERPADLE